MFIWTLSLDRPVPPDGFIAVLVSLTVSIWKREVGCNAFASKICCIDGTALPSLRTLALVVTG